MSYIAAKHISLSIAGRPLLSDASFTLQPGERVGVIGANGAGKSTLMRLIAGDIEPDAGTVARHPDVRIGFLRQQPVFDESKTVGATLAEAVGEFESLHDELRRIADQMAVESDAEERATLLSMHGELSARIEAAGAWSAEQRMAEAASRFGLEMDAPVSILSGGWRKRLAIARMLLSQPDILLLDEPTNHLDVETISFLEDIIRRYHGSVLLITHDRYFLDRVVSRIIEVESAQLVPYEGTYSDYLVDKSRRMDMLVRQHDRRMKLIKSETAFLNRTPQARGTKSESRIRELEALKKIPPPRMPREVTLDLIPESYLGNVVLDTVELGKSYNGRTLFRKLSFSCERGERIGIIGPNGCGKTTLFRILLQQERQDEGFVNKPRGVVVSHFDQTRSSIKPNETIYDAVNNASDYVRDGIQRKHIHAYLEDFLFEHDDLRRRVDTLSGGEKARVALARMLLEGANLLLLDEPTNDLDIPTMQVLESALTSFAGCSLIITHDRFFLDRVATSILDFEPSGNVTRYYGNYTLYRRLRANKDAGPEDGKEVVVAARREELESAGKPAKKKQFGYRQQQELTALEKSISKQEAEVKALEVEMAADGFYQQSHQAIKLVCDRHDVMKAQLNALYARWEELAALQAADGE